MKLKTVASIALAIAAMSASAQNTPIALSTCDKPMASIMVGKLACKAGNCSNPSAGSAGGLAALLMAGGSNVAAIGDGIKDMMTTALQESGCFDVMERETMDEIEAELSRAGKTVKTKQADYMVSGAVTQIDMQKDTTSIGWGMIPIIGSVGTTKNSASVSLDLRLVDVNAAQIVGTKKISASTESRDWGVNGLGIGGGVGFGGGFSSLKGTNLEAVVRDAVYQSVNYLSDEIKRKKM